MAHNYPWKQHKASIVGNEVDVFFSAFSVPTDETVPTGNVAGGCRERKAANRSFTGKYHVFALLTYRVTVAQIVILFDQTRVQFFILGMSDLSYLKGL